MAFDQQLVKQAVGRQEAAAHDPAGWIRLVAGPGSGKSFSIEGRVVHLLRNNVAADRILAVSFTRNAAKDLEKRIRTSCGDAGLPGIEDVPVATLHSVALRVLRLANLLTMYPVDPRVLDEWEMGQWIDAEFARFANVSPGRAREVREYHEAWWSTGQQNPANYIPANPPVSGQEQQQFVTYHNMQTGFYACLLVGEIMRTCMQNAGANTIDPRALLGVDHLIVDEYQDLNPVDLNFVDYLIGQGVAAFVAGDDDQSVYSFRHASPQGIQTFKQRFPAAADHMLSDCFRCTPAVLNAALGVLAGFTAPARIPKTLSSLYGTANPPVPGHAHWWKYSSPQAEAAAIAESCLELHDAGLNYGDIMILLGNRRATSAAIQDALTARGIPMSPVQVDAFRDTAAGRTGFSILRILIDPSDLVAHRNLLSLMPQMGTGRCLDVTVRCRNANISAVDLYQGHIPNGALTSMQLNKIDEVRTVVGALHGWSTSDTASQRGPALSQLVEDIGGAGTRQEWDTFIQTIPAEATLNEVSDLLYADSLEDRSNVVSAIHSRLGLPAPPTTDPNRVQILTMHGAKGLSAKVVFIPSLEETVFPNQRRAAKPGLVDEGARLLYVSITRARAAVFLTCTHSRNQNGAFVTNPPSRYLLHTGLQMQYRPQPTPVGTYLAQSVAATCMLL
ncbi:MAG: ATP-dependent helicase [Actinomycetota bacterium]|nr:ATP-dependent helicase [Actinomycetota bacterium]